MKRRMIAALLVMTVLFMFSLSPAFAATKKVTQTAEKDYEYTNSGSTRLTYSWEDTYNTKGVRTDFDAKVYTYPSGKQKVTKYHTDYSYKNGKVKTEIRKENGKKTYKNTYTYKSNGSISQDTLWKYNSKTGKWVKQSYTKYTYSKTKETITDYNKKGKVIAKTVMTLDSKGRVTKEVYYEDGDKTSTTTNDYYTNGVIKKAVVKFEDGGKDVYKYDKKGNMTSSVIETADGYVMTSTYTYNDQGLMTKEVMTDTYEDYTNKTVYKYSYSNFYNSNKKYPKTTIVKMDGEKVEKRVKTYKKI